MCSNPITPSLAPLDWSIMLHGLGKSSHGPRQFKLLRSSELLSSILVARKIKSYLDVTPSPPLRTKRGGWVGGRKAMAMAGR